MFVPTLIYSIKGFNHFPNWFLTIMYGQTMEFQYLIWFTIVMISIIETHRVQTCGKWKRMDRLKEIWLESSLISLLLRPKIFGGCFKVLVTLHFHFHLISFSLKFRNSSIILFISIFESHGQPETTRIIMRLPLIYNYVGYS